MAGRIPDAVELGRRVRAARTYAGVSQIDLARRLGVGPDTLGRWENGKTAPGYKREALLEATAQLTSLPQEFFVIEFSSLPEMVAAWQQVRREGATAEDLIAAQEKDEGSLLPGDPSASPTEEQEPGVESP
jgi:transcriptional regulator with XRE-family HTH domain